MKDILEELDVTKEELEASAFELYVPQGFKEGYARDKFRYFLEIYLNDINVKFLIYAGILLHEKIEKEMPEINKDDPGYLVVDEILGLNIANYIGGTNAIFNFVRYDKEKPGILSKLEAMIDDIVGGLIAGIMTKVYDDLYQSKP